MEPSIGHRPSIRLLTSSVLTAALVLTNIGNAEQQTFDASSSESAWPESHRGKHEPLLLPQTTACLDAALTRGRNANAYSGFSTAVMLDGRVVYRRGFGTVSPTSTQPVSPSTRFRFGSIVKSMTATALLSLAEERRVGLHAPIQALLPGLELPGEAGWSQQLTAHRLLSHQGGIQDTGTLNGPRDDGALAAAFYDPAFLQTVPLMVRPGTFYNYSNPNYELAGLVAETAAGMPYRRVMKQRVFRPLDMKRTTFLPSEVLTDTDFAYGVMGSTIWAPNDYDNAIGRPAGFGWTSADDLAKFTLFILHGNPHVLSPRLWRAMQSRQVNTLLFHDIQGYGYGLGVDTAASLLDREGQLRFYDGVKVVSHNGAIAGYRSFMVTLPAQRFGYVALVNGDVENPLVDQAAACFRVAAAETISDRLPAPSPFPAPHIQRDRFTDYAGVFSDRVNVTGRMLVSLTPAGELQVQFPDLNPDFEYNPILQPIRRDNFLLHTEVGSLVLTGIRGATNRVEHLRMREVVLSRLAEEPSALRSSATIDPGVLEKIVREAARDRNVLWDLPE